MKFVLICVLLIGVNWCEGRVLNNELQDLTKDGENDKVDIQEIIKEYLDKRCTKVGSKVTYEDVLQAIESAATCLGFDMNQNTDELVKNFKDVSTPSVSSSEELCSEKRISMQRCFKTLIDVMQECSKPEEKYLPNFIFQAIDSLIEYACVDNGSIIFKIFNNTTVDCLEVLSSKDNLPCINKFASAEMELNDDTVLTKSDLCSSMEVAKNCYTDYLTQECPFDKNLKDIVRGVHKAVSTPCTKSDSNSLNLNLP